MASRYKFSEEEIQELEQARKGNKDKRAEARLKALILRAKGAQKLLKEGEYDPVEKKKSSFKETVGAIYWVVATAIFLGWSFITNDWHQSWIVWPIAGVLFVAVMMICNLIINKNQEKK